MSFWNSKTVTARKKHVCQCCNRAIAPGERYSREAGVYAGEFQSYVLCERCAYVTSTPEYLEHFEDLLGDFRDWFIECADIHCPKCESRNIRDYEFSDDMMSCACECDKCGEKWTADLTVEVLKDEQEKERERKGGGEPSDRH